MHSISSNKLVSIVLPTYNGSRFIRDSIESVINQTYKHWELIIVNDCSKDDTLTIAKEYEEQDSRIRVISNEINKKLPASLNVGFLNANGAYWTWTSDDNIFKKNAIEYMSDYLGRHPDVDLVSCNFDIVNEDLTFICSKCDTYQRSMVQLAFENQVGACFMYTRDIAKKVGEYDTTLFCAEDYDYWCRIAKIGKISYEDEKNLYIYRMNSGSLTSTKLDEVMAKTRAIWHKHSNDILEKLGYNQRQKSKIFFDFYNKNGKDKEWLAFSKNADPKYYLLKKIHHSIAKIGESIFSIKNKDDKKIIRFLGIKILSLHRKIRNPNK